MTVYASVDVDGCYNEAGDMHAGVRSNLLTEPRTDRRYTIMDWAHLHGFDVAACLITLKQELEHATPVAFGSEISDCPVFLSAEAAWDLAAETMARRLPSGKEIIWRTHEECQREFIFRSEGGPPCTRLLTGNSTPFVYCPYNRRPEDVLNIAHEFAHAVQLMATGRHFMPPVNREFCAFIGERIFIDDESVEKIALDRAYQRRRAYFAGVLLERLIHALEKDDSRYTYWWNYPLALLASERAINRSSEEVLWGYFCQQASPGDWLAPSRLNDGMMQAHRNLPSG